MKCGTRAPREFGSGNSPSVMLSLCAGQSNQGTFNLPTPLRLRADHEVIHEVLRCSCTGFVMLQNGD